MSAACKECPFLKRPWWKPWKKRTCIEDKCSMWIKLIGKDPQSGDPINEYDCAFRWGVVTQIENTKETIRVADEVKVLRDEMVNQGQVNNLVKRLDNG